MTMHRHYSYYWRRCRDCGAIAVDCSEYCEDCRDIHAQIEADEREAQEADSIPSEAVCSCTMPYVPSNALYPPEPILDRYCPIHGDGGPDPDRALEERRDQIREDRNPRDNED